MLNNKLDDVEFRTYKKNRCYKAPYMQSSYLIVRILASTLQTSIEKGQVGNESGALIDHCGTLLNKCRQCFCGHGSQHKIVTNVIEGSCFFQLFVPRNKTFMFSHMVEHFIAT